MTISSTNRKAGPYSGNGVTVNFPFAFKVFSASDLYVVSADPNGNETVLLLATDYTVVLNANQDSNPGGTVTRLTALDTGNLMTISSALDYLQPTDLTNHGGFYPKVINISLDRITIFIQQLAEQMSRALKYAITSQLGDAALPAPVANNVIGWNSSANGFQNYAPVDNTLLAASLAASGGASLVGFIQAGTGAVASTVQTELRRVVYAEQYGVSPSNTAGQNDLAFAKAIAAVIVMGGGEIELGIGNHQISYPIALDTGLYTMGIALVGKGRNTIITQTGTGQDVIKFSTTQFLQNSYLKNLQLVAGSTSGHVVNIVYGCTCCYFDNVEMVQNNPAKALIYGDWTSFGGGVYDTKFRGGSWYCHPASTEAGIRIKANGTIFNENVFENLRCYNANYLQFFHVTTNTTASIWLTNNTLSNINFEICKGGGVLATSAKGWTLQNLNFWDAGGAYTNHLIDFAAGSGYESTSNVLMNISRNGDSLAAGVNDIRILSGQDTTIINCYTSGSPVYDFGGKRVTVIGPLIGTINNKTAMLWLGSQSGGIQFPGSINGSLLNYYDEGTFTAKLTGTVTPPTVPVTTVARWTRIGRQVSVEGIFPADNTTGASGNVSITGLPFAVGAVPAIATIAISGLGTDAAVGVASNGTTSITLVKAADIVAGITMVAGTNKHVYFSLQYTV